MFLKAWVTVFLPFPLLGKAKQSKKWKLLEQLPPVIYMIELKLLSLHFFLCSYMPKDPQLTQSIRYSLQCHTIPWAFVREQILTCFHHLLTSYIFLPLWWALKSIRWRGRDFSQETECFAAFLRFVTIKPVKGLPLQPVHKVTFSRKLAVLRDYSQLSCMHFCSRETRVVEKMIFLLAEKMI